MQYLGLYHGVITFRDDPMHLCRVKVSVPGILEPEASDDGPWAYPKGAGSAKWGRNSVPPIGADVYVQFVNGDINSPVWEPAMPGAPIIDGVQRSEAFPEHESPDVHVFGVGWFRLVIDDRDGQRSLRLKLVKTVGGQEQDVVWLDINGEDNSLQLFATSALEVKAGAILNLDAATVQVRGRKVTPSPKPIN